MANQILVDNFPGGRSIESAAEIFRGSIALCGSAVSTGEPLNWANLVSGVGYNEVNRLGGGGHGSGCALTTGFAISAGICTVTAANNFQVGQLVTFLGNTQTLSALFNGILPVQILTASASSFTFATTITGTTTTGDVGLAVTGNANVFPLQGANGSLSVTVSALSASGTTLTVTGTNSYLPGAQVVVSVATGTLGPKLAGLTLTVLASTSTAFTALMPAALTGSTGIGTALGINPPQPFSVKVWSGLGSGYIYQYSRTTGVLYVLDVGVASGTISAPTITTTTGTPATLPIGVDGSGALTQTTGATGITGVQAPTFTGAAAAGLAKLGAGAYPSGVLNDLIRYEATFQKA